MGDISSASIVAGANAFAKILTLNGKCIYSSKSYYSGSNQSIVVCRFGLIRMLKIWNTPYSTVNTIKLDAIDGPIGNYVFAPFTYRSDGITILTISGLSISVPTSITGNVHGQAIYMAEQYAV